MMKVAVTTVAKCSAAKENGFRMLHSNPKQ